MASGDLPDKMRLAQRIAQTQVAAGEVALFSLAQAGFCIKTPAGKLIYLDCYLSDCCERLYGFKRMSPPVMAAEEAQADFWASTHFHEDHLDTDLLPTLLENPQTLFLGAPDCEERYIKAGVPKERYVILKEGESRQISGVDFRAIYCDHGEAAPQAIGLLLTIDGIRLYHTGDTALRPEQILASLNSPVDIMIAPINGQFGNLDAREACELAKAVKPKLLIACHFWMFIEHGGDPAAFLQHAEALKPDIQAVILAPGELLMFPQALRKP